MHAWYTGSLHSQTRQAGEESRHSKQEAAKQLMVVNRRRTNVAREVEKDGKRSVHRVPLSPCVGWVGWWVVGLGNLSTVGEKVPNEPRNTGKRSAQLQAGAFSVQEFPPRGSGRCGGRCCVRGSAGGRGVVVWWWRWCSVQSVQW